MARCKQGRWERRNAGLPVLPISFKCPLSSMPGMWQACVVCAAVRRLSCFGRPGARGGCLAAVLQCLACRLPCGPTAHTFSRFLARRLLETAPRVDQRADAVNRIPNHFPKISVRAHGVTTSLPTSIKCRCVICVVRPHGRRSQQEGERRVHGVQLSSRSGLLAPGDSAVNTSNKRAILGLVGTPTHPAGSQ